MTHIDLSCSILRVVGRIEFYESGCASGRANCMGFLVLSHEAGQWWVDHVESSAWDMTLIALFV